MIMLQISEQALTPFDNRVVFTYVSTLSALISLMGTGDIEIKSMTQLMNPNLFILIPNYCSRYSIDFDSGIIISEGTKLDFVRTTYIKYTHYGYERDSKFAYTCF